MRVIEQRTYVGPNLYATFPVIRMTVDLGPLEQRPSASIPGFVDGLVERIPSLAEHGCSYGEPGGLVRRLREDGGTWLGHVLEHVAIELQNLAACQVSFGKTRSTGTLGHYHVVYEYEDPWVAEASMPVGPVTPSGGDVRGGPAVAPQARAPKANRAGTTANRVRTDMAPPSRV